MRFARKFAADVIGLPSDCAGDENAILMPEDGGREGGGPVVRQCVSYDAEGHAIAEWLLGRKAAGYQWAQMAVLYPRHFIGDRFEKNPGEARCAGGRGQEAQQPCASGP